MNDTDALVTAGLQWNDDHVYGEPRGVDEDNAMAEEVCSLWLSAIFEYVWTYMQFEYGYPLRFASLLVDRPAFPEKLKSVRAHYAIVLK